MFQLVSCITEQHNWLLLLVAVCVCTAGNLAGVFMLSRAQQCMRAHPNLWLAVPRHTHRDPLLRCVNHDSIP
jgi:NO-binding membrane sensor protein with MHYT domain